MGVITISISDDVEKRFREFAKLQNGERKGHLGDAVTEAIEKWMKDQEAERATKRFIERMRKGFKVGKILYKNRDELYDR